MLPRARGARNGTTPRRIADAVEKLKRGRHLSGSGSRASLSDVSIACPPRNQGDAAAQVFFPFLGLPCYPYELLEKRTPAFERVEHLTSGDMTWPSKEPCPS